MGQVSYAGAGVAAPANNSPNDAAFFRAILDAIMTGYNATDTTVAAAAATGVSNGGKLAKFAADGSMTFAATSSFATINATGAIAANGNVTTAGVFIAGSGSNQITTAAGLLDVTKLSGAAATATDLATGSILGAGKGGTGLNTLPAAAVLVGNGTSALSSIAPGAANNVLVSNGSVWQSAALSASFIADGSVAFSKWIDGRVTANGTNLTLTIAPMRYLDQNLNPVIFGGTTYTIPGGQVPSGGNNVWIVVYESVAGTVGSVAGTPAVSPTRPTAQPNSQTLAYVYLRDGTTAVYQSDQSTAHTGYVEDWRNPWTFGGGSGGGGGALSFPLTVSQGGTNATDPTSARSQLGAAASGSNADITGFASAIAFGSSITQSGTYAPAAANSPLAHSIATILKPTASGGVPRFFSVTGTVDTSGIPANATNNINTAAAYFAGVVQRSGSGHSRNDMFDVWNLFTTNGGTPNGGSYSIADGQGHTTASIAGTALVGALDGSTASTINNALVVAGSALRAVDGELASGTSVNLVQITPGPQAAPTLPANAITTVSPAGGSLVLTQTTVAQLPLYQGVAYYANQPQNNVSNIGILLTGNLASPGGVVGQSANEYGFYANMTIPAALGAYQGWQKTGIGSTVTVNQGRQTRTVGTIEGDAVAGDFTVLSPNGITNVNLWGLHVEAKIGSSSGGGATGTAIGIEGQVISYSATDPGRMDSGLADHAIGINMVAGEPGGTGQQNLTAAYVVGAINNDATGATKPVWHQGFFVATRVANGGAAIGNGATDTAFELQDQWGVFLGGKMSVGSTTRAATSDLLEVISTATNGITLRYDQFGHVISTQASSPTAAGGTAAGTSPTITVTGTDQAGLIKITAGTSPTGSNTLATITFRNAYAIAPNTVILTPANATAANITNNQVYVSGVGTTTFTVFCLATLVAASSYWYYYSIG